MPTRLYSYVRPVTLEFLSPFVACLSLYNGELITLQQHDFLIGVMVIHPSTHGRDQHDFQTSKGQYQPSPSQSETRYYGNHYGDERPEKQDDTL